jgi:Icc-related predicted phosphoesterase
MRFLAFGDIVENREALEKFSKLDFSSYDFVVFCGDILSMEVFKKIREQRVTSGKIPETEEEKKKQLKEEFETKELLEKGVVELKELNKFFEIIKNKIPIYGVWGNADHQWIVSQAKTGKYFQNLHMKAIKINEFHLIGYEGRPKYIFETYDNPTEHVFDEHGAFVGLSKLFEQTKGKMIFVTHAPPYEVLDQVEENYRKYAVGTYGDKAKDGHIGSIAFGKIDEKFNPIIHLFGHIHECKGVKRIGKTTFINTGSFGKELELAEVEIQNDEIKVNFLKL